MKQKIHVRRRTDAPGAPTLVLLGPVPSFCNFDQAGLILVHRKKEAQHTVSFDASRQALESENMQLSHSHCSQISMIV